MLTTDASGTLIIKGDIHTINGQTFNDPTTLMADDILLSNLTTGGITFNSTLAGDGDIVGSNDNLTIELNPDDIPILDPSQNVLFVGNVGGGVSMRLNNLTIIEANDITFNGTLDLRGNYVVNESNDVLHEGAVDIEGDATFSKDRSHVFYLGFFM